MMRNNKLGEDVTALVIELWPALATKWSPREREVLTNRIASMPIDFEQAEAAIVNFKCTFSRAWPSVGNIVDALRGAINVTKPAASSTLKPSETPEQRQAINATEQATAEWLVSVDDDTFAACLYICRQWPSVGERFKAINGRDQVVTFPVLRGLMRTVAEYAGLAPSGDDINPASPSAKFARRMLEKYRESNGVQA